MYISALNFIGDFMRKGKRFKEKVKNNKIRIIILSSILIISIIMIALNLYYQNTIKDDKELQDILNDNSQVQNTEIETTPEETTKTERMIMLEELQKENSDIIGWLEIPDTNISYPVLQGEDNNFYVTHNYKKEYSINGSLFLDKDYDWSLPSTNLLIRGHNNRGTNEMFCRSY